MDIRTISQPEVQLGNEIDEILEERDAFDRIVFVSAFVSLRTILRMREQLLEKQEAGARLRLIVGIDLGGTSREVLEELLLWRCEVFICHNAIPRSTFHPKVYMLRRAQRATLFLGSNNLTDGGFYTNYEAATRYDFDFPADEGEFLRLVAPLASFFEPQGDTVQPLNAELITTLAARGELPSEADARRRQRNENTRQPEQGADVPENPFGSAAVPRPPLLPDSLRQQEPESGQPPFDPEVAVRPQRDAADQEQKGVLVWRKILPRSDALQTNEGSHHVGGVRLTQARFENPTGSRIDSTQYFRAMFADYQWEREPGKHEDQEHAFIPMRIVIRGQDYGVRNFEVSHKPSGEAGQANYTTILRWGREFTPEILKHELTGAEFSLYETADSDTEFLIIIR